MTLPASDSARDLVRFMALFEEFRQASWDGWRGILARLTPNVREFYAAVGRGAGKSRIVALIACERACRKYRRVAGENIYVGVAAPDRRQAAVTFRYIVGLLKSVAPLSALIVAERADSVELSNGVVIEVITGSQVATRGRSYALFIVEEAAFLPKDESANPDVELLRAIRPALARVPGSLLAVISSPYNRQGVLWEAWRKYHEGAPDDVVFVQAPTLDLNPTFDAAAVAKAYDDDPVSASAEYGAAFRADVEDFVSREAVEAVTVPGRGVLPPVEGVEYAAFVDPAGGSGGDSFTLAIGHDANGIAVLDAIVERKPPYSPEQTVREFADLLQQYGVLKVSGDRYAGSWPSEQFQKRGITYEPSARTKSELYLEFLPMLNSGQVELLDLPRLKGQLTGLERRTARGGRDSVDHAPGAHDDVINAAAGALVGVAGLGGGSSVSVLRVVYGGGGAGSQHPNFPVCWSGELADPAVRMQRRVGEFAPRTGSIPIGQVLR